MNIVVDIGNTLSKVAFSDESTLTESRPFSSLEELSQLIGNRSLDYGIVSKVGKGGEELSVFLGLRRIIFLDHTTPIPIKNLYKTPVSLGMDRLSAVVGASVLYPNEASLSIDAGTCITYDYLDQHHQYLGGGISPGLSMRFCALTTFTTKLPLIQQNQETPLIGDSTENAIRSGIQHGFVFEVDGVISTYRAIYGPIKVLLTGGDADFFESRIKEPIFAVPNLVFIGLKRILDYNVY